MLSILIVYELCVVVLFMLPPYFTQYETTFYVEIQLNWTKSLVQQSKYKVSKKSFQNETISKATCNYTLLIMVCSFQRLMTALIIQLVGPTLANYWMLLNINMCYFRTCQLVIFVFLIDGILWNHICSCGLMLANTPISSYDGVTSLCWCSSVSKARKVFVYVNGGTDEPWDA